VLLDLIFDANLDGIEVCRRLRTWSLTPVIMTSTCNDEQIKVSALDAGADDFMVKPFGVDEFLARVRAILRRLAAGTGYLLPSMRLKDLKIDLEGHTVW
jgi:two-component system, OmpR family, KDP operon response regulator KdpE